MATCQSFALFVTRDSHRPTRITSPTRLSGAAPARQVKTALLYYIKRRPHQLRSGDVEITSNQTDQHRSGNLNHYSSPSLFSLLVCSNVRRQSRNKIRNIFFLATRHGTIPLGGGADVASRSQRGSHRQKSTRPGHGVHATSLGRHSPNGRPCRRRVD